MEKCVLLFLKGSSPVLTVKTRVSPLHTNVFQCVTNVFHVGKSNFFIKSKEVSLGTQLILSAIQYCTVIDL